MTRKINQLGLSIIKEFEGLELQAYKCPAGVWTIGFGHTDGVKKGDKITQEEAEMYLEDDLKWAEKAVSDLVSVPLNDNQFSALVSLVFNIGTGNFKGSSLLRVLNMGGYQGAAHEILKWHHANGRDLAGLIKRRKKEQALFLT